MAERNITTKLKLDGEAEYKSRLKSINAELKNHKSELQLVKQQYSDQQNSMQALMAKQKSLQSVQESQRAKVRELSEAYKNAEKYYESYGQKLEDSKQRYAEAREKLDALKGKVSESSKEYKDAEAAVQKYADEVLQMESAQQQCGDSMNAWGAKLNSAAGDLKRTDAELEKNTKYLEEAKRSIDGCATSIDAHGKVVRKSTDDLQKQNKQLKESSESMDKLASVLASAGLQKTAEEIVEALESCAEAADHFETSMHKVSTVLSDGFDTAAMENDLMTLSGKMGEHVDSLAESVYNAVSASVDEKKAVDFVVDSTKLAVAGFTEMTTATDVLTTGINAYKKNAADAGNVSDILIGTQRLGKLTVDELAKSIGQVIPIAATYKVGLENLSTSYVELTRSGINVANATTDIKAMLSELGDTSSEVSTILQEETGQSFSQLMNQGKSLGDVMDILMKSVGGSKEEFAQLWSQSTTAGVAALTILSAGSKDYNKVLGQLKNSAGETDKAYEKMTDTAEHAGKKMQVAFENLQITIGKKFSPAIVAAEEKMTDLADASADFLQEHPEMVAALGAIATGLTVLTTGLAAYTVATQVVIPLIKAFNAALMENPAGLVAVGITTLVSALVAFSALSGGVEESSGSMAASMRDMKAAAEESAGAYEESSGQYRATADEIMSLYGKIEELSAIENRSAEQKKELKQAVSDLNALVPDLGLSYDELTDSINGASDAMERAVREAAAQEGYAAAVEARKEAYNNQQKAAEDLEKAEKKLKKATSDYNKELKDPSPGDALYILGSLQDQIRDYSSAVDDGKAALEDYDRELQQATDDQNYYALILADLDDVSRNALDSTLALVDGIAGSGDAYSSSLEALQGITEQHMANMEAMQLEVESIEQQKAAVEQAYQAMYDSCLSSMEGQFGLFDQASMESEEYMNSTVAAAQAALETQLSYWETYGANVQTLKDMSASDLGLTEEQYSQLIEQVSSGSEEAAGLAASMVNDIKTNNGEGVKSMALTLDKVKQAQKTTADNLAKMVTDYEAQMSALDAKAQQAAQNLDKYSTAYQSALNTLNGYLAGTDALSGTLISKYASLGASVTAAYNNALQIKSPSRRFKESAHFTIQGAIVGTDEKKGDLLNTYSTLGKDAIAAYSKSMEDAQKKIQGKSDNILTSGKVSKVKTSNVAEALADAVGNAASMIRKASAKNSSNSYQAAVTGIKEGLKNVTIIMQMDGREMGRAEGFTFG